MKVDLKNYSSELSRAQYTGTAVHDDEFRHFLVPWKFVLNETK